MEALNGYLALQAAFADINVHKADLCITLAP